MNQNFKFRGSISAMIAKGDLFHNAAVKNLSELNAIDPEITTSWLAEFETKIEAARSYRTPGQTLGSMMEATADVKAQVKAGANAYQELMFYVKKAFPGRQGKVEQYGSRNYKKAVSSPQEMVNVLDMARAAMTEDATELEAVGYSAGKISAFGSLYAQLYANYQLQQSIKAGRRDTTTDYYAALNAVWADMVTINRASKLAFMDDYPRYRMFLLYGGKKSAGGLTLKIAAKASVYHQFEKPLKPGQKLHFHMTKGKSAANICFTEKENFPCAGPIKTLQTLAEETWTYENFGVSGQVMKLVNTGEGEMRVRVRVVEGE